MDDTRNWAIGYLAARGDAPWRWADDGEVITWADGTTIAFREEVAFVLEWLIPQGWPPFGALVWLLAACRGKLPPSTISDVPFAPTLDREAAPGQLPLSAFVERVRAAQASVEAVLAGIARLPEATRSSQKAKAVIAEAIFAANSATSGDQALRQAVLEVLRSGALSDVMLNQSDAAPGKGTGEFAALSKGLAALDLESLALRLRTGLDALPRAATLPAAPATRVRAMLAELRTDPEHAGLARLARDFMASLQLPRALSEPDEMPIGGFADLSNRGNLDRLLLSELAHDDLTLAVRIALQEALYLRREPPVKQPPSTLAVLLDSGVRLWGVPRVLATAVALALIGKSSQHGKLAVFRATGTNLAPVDLLTKEGLTVHLSALETHAHPGAALPAFQRALDDAERHDAVLITQRDVAQDPAFRRSLQAAKFDTLYLATVDRDGSFELLRSPHTAVPVCRAQVNVDDLLPAPPTPDKSRPVLIDRAAHPELPLIFSASPFPLLVSVRGNVQASVNTSETGGLCVLQDHRLMRWRERGLGAQTVSSNLPNGRTVWLGELADGSVCVVKSHSSPHQAACRIFGTDGTTLHSHDWPLRKPPLHGEAHGGVFYLVCANEALAYDLTSGALLSSIGAPHHSSHGRYFFQHFKWHILVWDGHQLSLDEVQLSPSVLHESVLRVFFRRGHEGPWFVTRNGDIYSGNGTRVLQLEPIRQVVAVADDGARLLVITDESGKTEMVDLLRSKRRAMTAPFQPRDWQLPVCPPAMGVRARFARIAVAAGEIRLYSENGTEWDLECHDDRLQISKGKEPLLAQAVSFETMAVKTPAGVAAKVARWPDGRVAWLDRNGMLHLRCADRTRPEITIVLCDGALAAWSSDGLWHGRKFFIGDHESSPAPEIWRRILNFTE